MRSFPTLQFIKLLEILLFGHGCQPGEQARTEPEVLREVLLTKAKNDALAAQAEANALR